MNKSRSSKRKIKRIIKIAAAALLAVVLVCGIFVGITVWETNRGEYKAPSSFEVPDSALEYDGKKYDLKEDVETILVMGLDKYEQAEDDTYSNNMQADFLMLLIIDNDAQKCTALHINRDTITSMNVLGVAGDKVDVVSKQIALAHTYGNGKEISCRNTAEAVSNLLLGIEIDYYLSVTMEAVEVYNDFVGGVEVTVLDDFKGIDDTLVKGETVTLMGEHALHYVRSRYGLEDSSNNHRMERQKQYLKALYDKTQWALNNDSDFIVNAASKLTPYIVSNCSGNKLQSVMEKIADYELTEIRDLEGESVKGESFMEFYPDGKSVEETVISLFYTPRD